MSEVDLFFEVTVIFPEGVIDCAAGALPPFKDFSSACLSAGVISSELLECFNPAFCILSRRAESEIFNTFANCFTVKAKINPFLFKPIFSCFHNSR